MLWTLIILNNKNIQNEAFTTIVAVQIVQKVNKFLWEVPEEHHVMT